ncbi:MAG: iron-sulfur cluster assembly protein, partial [Thermomicrobiales bacterium]
MSAGNGLPELTKELILETLRPVKDPATGQSLVDAKMIPTVEIDGRNVVVLVELTTPVGSQSNLLEDEVRAALNNALPDLGKVAVKVTSRIRASGSGRSDAQPIKGVKNT